MRPTSSRSLCLPPARAHFCELTARLNGGTSSPTKYGLNGTMPATVNSTVGSCGIRLADGTGVWPVAAKKSMNDWRSSSAVRGGVLIVLVEPTGRSPIEPVGTIRAGGTCATTRAPRPARVDQLRGPRRAAHVGVRRHVPALELHVHLRRRLQGHPRRRRHRAGAGLLQLRRPLRRRRRRRQRRRAASCASSPRHMQFHAEAGDAGLPRPGEPSDDGSDHGHPAGRRRVHLPQPARVRRRRRLRAAHRRARGRRAAARLEAERVLAGADLRLEHSTDENGHVTSRCASGSAATGARAATTSTGGAPRRPTRSSATEPVYRSAHGRHRRARRRSAVYDQMVRTAGAARWSAAAAPRARR